MGDFMKKEIVNKIKNYLADTSVLYIKLHNLHWNLVGLQFKSVHEYLESLYDNFAEVLDEVAELLKMHGEIPLASMKDYLATSKIEEIASKDIAIADVLAITLKDMQTMKATAETIRKEADEEDIFDVVGMLEDHISNYNKTIWFLQSMVK